MKRRVVWIVMVSSVLGAGVAGSVWYVRHTGASRLLDRAGVAMEARKYDKAVELSRQYVDKTRDWRGWLLMGRAYNKLGEHDAARAALSQAEERFTHAASTTGAASAEICLAVMESYTIPAQALLSRQGGDRVSAVREALALLDRARAAAEDGHGDAAADIALRSGNGLNYVALAKAELSLAEALTRQAGVDRAAGLAEQADAELSRAADAKTRSREQLRRAADVLLAVLADDPSHTASANAMADAVIELDDPALLERAGTLLLAVAPERRPPLAWSLITLRTLPTDHYPVSEPFRGQALQRLAEVDTLLNQPREDRLTGAEVARIRRRMGQAYMRLDLPDQALAMFDLALRADARDPMSQLCRGQVLLQRGDVEAARKQLYELVSQYGDWAEAQFWYAQAALRRGETTLALQSLRRATRSDRSHTASRRAIIDILLAQTPPQPQQAYDDGSGGAAGAMGADVAGGGGVSGVRTVLQNQPADVVDDRAAVPTARGGRRRPSRARDRARAEFGVSTGAVAAGVGAGLAPAAAGGIGKVGPHAAAHTGVAGGDVASGVGDGPLAGGGGALSSRRAVGGGAGGQPGARVGAPRHGKRRGRFRGVRIR